MMGNGEWGIPGRRTLGRIQGKGGGETHAETHRQNR
jgi:hypothetical protein